NITIEIYVVENDIYYGGLIISKELSVEKKKTFISIIPDKIHVLPNETVSIDFKLWNIFNELLIGEYIEVEIKNLFYSANFTIQIGVNDTYELYIPSAGMFDIIGKFIGDERHYAAVNSTRIYSSKIELEIKITILESFRKNITCGFLGYHWNFSILDYHKNFTLVANVTFKGYNIPAVGVEIFFYLKQHFKGTMQIGSNLTNSEGIAIFKWDTTNYSMPCWFCTSALFAKVEESEIYKESQSDSVYFTLRKIFTFVSLKTFTSKFRINVDYIINVSLYDEFGFRLDGFNLTVKVYDPDRNLVNTYKIITNKSAHIPISPVKLGYYKIKVYFSGTELYHSKTKIKFYKCIEKEPTSINIYIPDILEPDKKYDITIELINSTGALVLGEIIEVLIMYRDDTGKTALFDFEIVTGINNTFQWVFPEFDKYIIKASYKGSDDYAPSSEIKTSMKCFQFKLNILHLLTLLFMPCLIIPFTGKERKGYSKKKKMIMGFALIFAILGSSYAMMTFTCSQTEGTGLIGNVDCNSNYQSENPLFKEQNQDPLNDMMNFGSTNLEGISSNIDPKWIPDLVNMSSPYDLIYENSSKIPPEIDINPPILRFLNIKEGLGISDKILIELNAIDRESGIRNVIFQIFNINFSLVEGGDFFYNASTKNYEYKLDTLTYKDGEYFICATAFDNNNNNQTETIRVEIINNPPSYDFEDLKLDYVLAELTDNINITYTSLADGIYNVLIKNNQNKIIYSISGKISKYEVLTLILPIDPLFFKEGSYKLLISISARNVLGILKTETQELSFLVAKESVQLQLDIVEKDEIYNDHFITFRARLFEDDWTVSENGERKESEIITPISGQVLTFELTDSDNYNVLGTSITDKDGYAIFSYFVDLTKGYHSFNVSYAGNNFYKPIENLKLFKNQGELTFIDLYDVKNPLRFNTFGSISAQLFDDKISLPNQTLYFNISNSFNNYYVGMANTNSNGVATIEFPSTFLPGIYDVKIYYNGDTTYSENINIFEEFLTVLKEQTKLTIITGYGSTIKCPYFSDTEIVAQLLINGTDIGIEDIPISFKLIENGIHHELGTYDTDSNGFASIIFNPSKYNFTPTQYILSVSSLENNFYEDATDYVNLNISKDIPIINIEGTNTYFLNEFQLNATLTDSLLTPLENKELVFSLLNTTNKFELYSDKAITNDKGIATLFVPSGSFKYNGTFDIQVSYSGDKIVSSATNKVEKGLNILSSKTRLFIISSDEGIPTESLDIDLILTDEKGTLIKNQPIFLECYRENSTVNLLSSRTIIFTDINSGIASYSLPLLLPGNYKLLADFRPQYDEIPFNDGFVESQAEFNFSIVRIPATLSIEKISSPQIMRGESLEFTVISKSEAAKNYIIPVRLYVDKDINGDGIAHDDVLGEFRFIYYGVGNFSYQIPLGPLYQAGIYNFSIEIEDEGSIFEGSTSILIDLVERTTISISYEFLNPRAERKHYIWEPEKIHFILRDEDGMPLPEFNVFNYAEERINRIVHYQIINGKNVYGSEEVNLGEGKFFIIHKPDSYGYEFCTAIYEGSRFFAPAIRRSKAEIFRRPLILHFLEYNHDNDDPERLNIPHSGHRGETLIIKTRVQDYLNLTYLEGHRVFFGYNRTYLDISNISNINGFATLKIPLTAVSGLIQAGLYNIKIKIYITEKYQSVENTSMTSQYSDKLYIYEIGYMKWNIGDFTTEGMNYGYKPTLYFFDEDNKILSNTVFFIELIDIKSGDTFFDGYFTSGKVQIPMYKGGKYQIKLTVLDSNVAREGSIEELATFYNSSEFYFFTAILVLYDILVIDVEIDHCYIPVFSEIITRALWESINYDASPLTVLFLVFMYFLFGVWTGVYSSSEQLVLTLGMLYKWGLVMLLLELGDFSIKTIVLALGLSAPIFIKKMTDAMNTGDWVINVLQFMFGAALLIAVAFIVSKLQDRFGKYNDIDEKFKGNAFYKKLIEIAVLLAIGWHSYSKECLEKKGLIKRKNELWWIFHLFHGFLWGVWAATKLAFEKWGPLTEKLSPALMLVVILYVILSHGFSTWIAVPLSEYLAELAIPKIKNDPFKNIRDRARVALKIIIRYALVALFSVILIPILKKAEEGMSAFGIIFHQLWNQVINIILIESTLVFITAFLEAYDMPQVYT
ncbi:MAG: hypothetical protein ACTSPD_20555, partial [Promethearchaeota archaeon]